MADCPKIETQPSGELWVFCVECRRSTRHDVLTRVTMRSETPDITFIDSYEVIQCRGCETFSFRRRHDDSEIVGEDENGNPEYDFREDIYPRRAEGRSPLDHLGRLSPAIASIYEEAHGALVNGLPRLAVAGLRAVVEAACHDREVKGESLFQRIEALVAGGLMTRADADLLQAVRDIGNEAVHEAKAAKESQLAAGFEVVEHMLKALYLLPTAQEIKKGKNLWIASK